MCELPPSLDLTFLVGCEVQQIRLGQFQTIIIFDRDVAISIEAEFTLDGSRWPASQGYVLHVLLGTVVTAVRRVSPVDLGITFVGHELVLHGVDNGYESYHITRPGDVIVV